MNYGQFLNNLTKGKFAPVYFLYGDEDYLMEEAVKRLIDALVEPASRDFNLDILYGDEINGGQIVNLAASYPMLSQWRVVVVKEMHKLSPQSLELLLKYTDRPSPTTCLILILPKAEFKLKQFTQFKQKAQWVEFKRLYDNQIPDWVRRHLREKGLYITEEAIRILQGSVGNSLRNLTNELEKIQLNIGDRSRIQAEDVEAVVGVSKSFNVFELSDSIGMKDIKRSLEIMDRLLESGESHTGIVIRLTRYFGTLLKVREWSKRGKSEKELANLAGVHPYFLRDYLNQARNFSGEKIQACFRHLLEADVNLKSSYQRPHLVMELLVYKLIKSRSDARPRAS